MDATACPALEELRRWQAGELPVAEAQALAQHLAHCARCRHALTGNAAAGSSDKTSNHARSESVEAIIEPTPALELSFLSPPQHANEIGQLDHFRIRKVIGEGGMGMVFEGEDTRLERTVAIKVLKPEQASDDVSQKRFLQEVRAVASIKNEHIVTIYHVGKENGVPYFAMELLAGAPLDRHLRQQGKLPLAEVLRLGREIAQGLAAAHERGLIHRDIKPSNLWLEEPGQRIKILDFGLARSQRRDEKLTETGHVMGTPDYMSPEQARGKDLDPRSDLFSLGSVLYELCTGRPPFEADTVTGVLTALAVDTPEPMRRYEPSVPRELEGLVAQLLEKKPEHRPASAREVADRLRALEAGQPAAPVIVERAIQAAPDRRGGQFDRRRSDRRADPERAAGSATAVLPEKPTRRSPWPRRLLWALAALLVSAPVLFFAMTSPGTVRVVCDDPELEVEINDYRQGHYLRVSPALPDGDAAPPGVYFAKVIGTNAEDYFVESPLLPFPVDPFRTTIIVVRKKGPEHKDPPGNPKYRILPGVKKK